MLTHLLLLVGAALPSGASSLPDPALPIPRAHIQEAEFERPAASWRTLPRRQRCYASIDPAGVADGEPRPVLIALPDGEQDLRRVGFSLERYWAHEGHVRGWTVIVPRLDELDERYPDVATVLGAVAADVRERIAVEGDRFYLAGIAGGGRDVFTAAAADPELWHALLVAPGFPADESADEALAPLPIAMYVGGDDLAWAVPMAATRDRLVALGADVRFTSFPGEGHAPESLTGKRLFDELEALRALVAERPRAALAEGASADPRAASDPAGRSAPATSEAGKDEPRGRKADARRAPVASKAAVDAVLDGLYLAASRADGERYFASFTPDAVIIGTDPEERWSLAEFRALAQPYFASGAGWTYQSRERHVAFSPNGDVAWFDERLDNDIYGEVRGSGVLIATDGAWRLAQYTLSFAVPNAVALDVVERIRVNQEQARGAPRSKGAAGEQKNKGAKREPAKDGKNAKEKPAGGRARQGQGGRDEGADGARSRASDRG